MRRGSSRLLMGAPMNFGAGAWAIPYSLIWSAAAEMASTMFW